MTIIRCLSIVEKHAMKVNKLTIGRISLGVCIVVGMNLVVRNAAMDFFQGHAQQQENRENIDHVSHDNDGSVG
jgi:hypothetical protein